MSYFDQPQSILFLTDGDIGDKLISVRLTGGVWPTRMALSLMGLERDARLIIERYKAGDKKADASGQLPRGFGGETNEP